MLIIAMIFASQMTQAQTIDDFETTVNNWKDVDGWQGLAENPYKSALNPSATVLNIVRAAVDAKFWVGAIRPSIPPTTGRYLHIKMFRNNLHKPKVKLSDTQPIEILPLSNIKIQEYVWQDIVFDIAAITDRQFILIMVDESTGQLDNDAIVYADDIVVNDDNTPRTATDPTDANKPVMGSAALNSVSFYTATLTLNATDTDGNNGKAPVFSYIANDASQNIINREIRINGLGKCILSGLKASTTYNLTLAAKDMSGNISDNTTTLSLTTETIPEQYVIDNFEGDNKGWVNAEGAHAVWIIENPFPTGINTSKKVMQTGRDANANAWAAPTIAGLNIAGGIYRYMHLMTYRNTVSPSGPVKLKVSDVPPVVEMLPCSTEPLLANCWQDIVFDLSVLKGANVDFIYFMMDMGVLSKPLILYIDNVELSNEAAPRTSALDYTSTSDISIISTDDMITIEQIQGRKVDVYRADGILVSSQPILEDRVQIRTGKGLFFVRVDQKCFKVLVR